MRHNCGENFTCALALGPGIGREAKKLHLNPNRGAKMSAWHVLPVLALSLAASLGGIQEASKKTPIVLPEKKTEPVITFGYRGGMVGSASSRAPILPLQD
jgi:hypothetical protein